jgi:hypothetical protein
MEAKMWSLLKGKREECERFRESLEESPEVTTLEPARRGHAGTCKDCQEAAEDLLESRELLKAVESQADRSRPWFAPRVMAAIAARESEVKRKLEAWSAVPKLAAKLTWVSAFVLLAASTWLYERPASTQSNPGQAVMDSVFENPPSTAGNDDVLVSMAEKAR